MPPMTEKERLIKLRKQISKAGELLGNIENLMDVLEMVDWNVHEQIKDINRKDNRDAYGPYAGELEMHQGVYVIKHTTTYVDCPTCGGKQEVYVEVPPLKERRLAKCGECSNGRTQINKQSPAERIISGIEVTFMENGNTECRFLLENPTEPYGGAKVKFKRQDIFLSEEECKAKIEELYGNGTNTGE